MRPDPPLYPEDPQQKDRALELEDHYDRVVAKAVRRLIYQHVLPERETAAELLAVGGGDDRVALFEVLYPAVGPTVRAAFSVPPISDLSDEELVEEEVRNLGELISGSDFLVGDSFSVADLTAAAFLAPLICPDAMPMDLPDQPASLIAIGDRLRSTEGGAWVDRTYRHWRNA